MSIRKSGAILVLLVVSGCESSSGRISKLLGGSAGIEIVRTPSRVEAFRVGPPEPLSMNFNHWPVLSGPVVLDAAQSAEASSLLLEGAGYGDWSSETGCGPSPGLKLVFSRNGVSRALLFCFECHEVYVYDDTVKVGYANFGPARDRLLEFFIKLFPADRALPMLRRPR